MICLKQQAEDCPSMSQVWHLLVLVFSDQHMADALAQPGNHIKVAVAVPGP